MFSDRLLDALGAWQNGWREDKARREPTAAELRAAIAAERLAEQFRTCPKTCYRKRFLVPNNTQNDGDFGPLFLNGFIKEGPAAWTTDEQFARAFKGTLRPATQPTIFAHLPQDGQVILNVPALWGDPEFCDRVDEYVRTSGKFAGAIRNFGSDQSEIIMEADLQFSEIHAMSGQIGPFEELFPEGTISEEEEERIWVAFNENDIFPQGATWLTGDSLRSALERTKEKFLTEHGEALEAAIEARKTP